ncbi:tripartite tricarboxylate transporter TctB family protein [Ruegeria hyattellae]|uniref:tripartite tricarboxylate transporter TctB family protein n=1 Tax=Ruegeria hyattellae TaxID=3233337 RepID=UPI00355B49C1
MEPSKRRDLFAGALFLVLGVLTIVILIPSGVDSPGNVEISALSPEFWPRVIALAVVFVALCLVAESYFLKIPAADPDEDAEADAIYQLDTLPGTLRTVILIFALFLFYFALTTLGVVASSIVLMLSMMLFFGERKWYFIVPISVLLPIFLYLFFLHVAGVPMPLGMFENIG